MSIAVTVLAMISVPEVASPLVSSVAVRAAPVSLAMRPIRSVRYESVEAASLNVPTCCSVSLEVIYNFGDFLFMLQSNLGRF